MLALACLLLIAGISTAQAAHIHGQVLPASGQQATTPADASQLPGSVEHCQLCVAMHLAMPTTVQVTVVHLELVEPIPAQVAEFAPLALWHYAMFSRPPPVASR